MPIIGKTITVGKTEYHRIKTFGCLMVRCKQTGENIMYVNSAAFKARLATAETYVHRECYTCKHWRPKTEEPCGAPGDGPCNAGARESWEWSGATYEDAICGHSKVAK